MRPWAPRRDAAGGKRREPGNDCFHQRCRRHAPFRGNACPLWTWLSSHGGERGQQSRGRRVVGTGGEARAHPCLGRSQHPCSGLCGSRPAGSSASDSLPSSPSRGGFGALGWRRAWQTCPREQFCLYSSPARWTHRMCRFFRCQRPMKTGGRCLLILLKTKIKEWRYWVTGNISLVLCVCVSDSCFCFIFGCSTS